MAVSVPANIAGLALIQARLVASIAHLRGYDLDDEERRAVREELTEAELAIFDLLTKPEPKLTKAQEVEVKAVARRLLEQLEKHLAAIDWTASQQTRGAVQSESRQRLNELPKEPYPRAVWAEKVEEVWQFVLRRYGGLQQETCQPLTQLAAGARNWSAP